MAGNLYCWHRGLKTTLSSDLATTNAFTPVAGVIFAYIILQEIPEWGQIAGGIIIMIGIAVALIETLQKEKALSVERARPKSFTGL